MSHQDIQEIPPGFVVEFFEAKEILCAVVQASKGARLSVITEQNREANLSRSRVLHVSDQPLDLKLSRDELVKRLKAIAAQREALMGQVDIEELWSLVEGEEESFDAEDMAGFVFSESPADHHVSAVQRVLLLDRIYFQHKDGRFAARSAEKVEQRRAELEREEEREAQLEQGSEWLQSAWSRKPRAAPAAFQDSIIHDLKSFCLFGQDYEGAAFVKELFKRANIPQQPQSAFRLLVRLGIWHENENLYLHQESISPDFPPEVVEFADRIAASAGELAERNGTSRRDLRHLATFTVDSALTRDYDDALSLTVLEDGLYEVGIHIADAAEFVAPGDPVDMEALSRASSIYLPDGRISMIPASLSEGACSLCAGQDRLAMSFIIRLDRDANIRGQEIVLSVVNVHDQLTYEEVDERAARDELVQVLYELALKLRSQRLERGAVILPLPEIQAYVNSAGMIQISHHEKETPSQIMVSEWMIAANGLAAAFLAEKGIAAIYRSQAECKPETEFVQSEHALFAVYRQRRLFARAELDVEPHTHCSLAMPYYTTVTSPIRRYSDLVVQRQIKHVLAKGEAAYCPDELRQLITRLGTIQGKIMFIQRKWTRYWILKYIEQEDLSTLSALVLDQNERFAHLLIPDFLIEANAPHPEKTRVQPGEMVKVKIERLNPRDDLLRVQILDFPGRAHST